MARVTSYKSGCSCKDFQYKKESSLHAHATLSIKYQMHCKVDLFETLFYNTRKIISNFHEKIKSFRIFLHLKEACFFVNSSEYIKILQV